MVNLFGNLNLNNNNYSTPLGESTTVNAQISDNNQLIAALKTMMPGQTLEGQLVSQDGKSLQLLIGGNTLLNTTLDAQANLSLGQNISFEIKSNNGGQLVLRPLHTNMSNDATAIKALENASVKVSEETIKMVDSLMKEGMPINRDALQSMNRDMNLFPNADINDLVMLHKLGLPVNETNVAQMNLYNNNNQWMMGNIENITDDVLGLLMESSEGEYSAIIDKLEALFGEQNENFVVENATIENSSNKTESQGVVVFSESELLKSEGKQDFNNVFNFLKHLSADKLNDKDVINSVKKQLNEIIGEKFLMEPDKVADKEYVKKYYEKVLDNTKELEQFLNQIGKGETNLSKSVSGIKDNVNFINQMNELYNYVQLPLKMAGGQASGDLYVYSKKRGNNQKDATEPLTALLHLSMEYLGNMDIFLKLTEGRLNTDFSLEKEEMIDFIESHIEELNGRLIEKGYNVNTSVGKLTEPGKNVIDDIRSESPKVSILSNQAFDARA